MRIGKLASLVMFKLRLHTLWRLMPRRVRRSIVRMILPPTRRTARLPQPTQPVIIVGPFRSHSSFGWLSRFLSDALTHAGVSVLERDVSEGFKAADAAPRQAAQAGDAVFSGPATVILVGTPDQFGYLATFLPKGALENKYLIGYCAWELERLPDEWLQPAEMLDEVWAISHFVAGAFKASLPHMKVRAVHCLAPPTQRPHPDRARWNLSESTCAFLLVFSLRSGLERKNPAATIAAFRQAFSADDDVILLIKASDAALEPQAFDALRSLTGGDPRIRFLTDPLPDEAMWSLLSSVDVVMSLHRAEGFGLSPAQAMMLGKPVVMTGWSSVLDFADATTAALVDFTLVKVDDPAGRFVAPLRWADPDISDAAAKMRALAREPELRRELGDRASQAIDQFIADANARLHRQITDDFLAPMAEGATRDGRAAPN